MLYIYYDCIFMIDSILPCDDIVREDREIFFTTSFPKAVGGGGGHGHLARAVAAVGAECFQGKK
jgi:hypothetical protein